VRLDPAFFCKGHPPPRKRRLRFEPLEQKRVLTVDVWIDQGSVAYEDGGSGYFVISRSDSQGQLTADYSVGGDAVAGTHYTALSGNASFEDTESEIYVYVDPIGNSLDEFDHSVVVTLISLPSPYNITGDGYASLAIQDDDSPPSLSISVGGPLRRADQR
jgi:hypothetical protein